MIKDITIDRQKKLQEVAEEYREQGYDVTLSPKREQLPEFLQPFQLDMIAFRYPKETPESISAHALNGDSKIEPTNVVVEIRTRTSFNQAPALDRVAEAIEDNTDWRLDLVVANPEGYSFWQHPSQSLLNDEDIHYRLQEAQELSLQEHGEAALLLTWSTLEALLRRDAEAKHIPLESEHRDNPLHLIKSLFTYGMLDREQYQILKSGVSTQYTMAHGYRVKKSISELLQDLFMVAGQLVEQPITDLQSNFAIEQNYINSPD